MMALTFPIRLAQYGSGLLISHNAKAAVVAPASSAPPVSPVHLDHMAFERVKDGLKSHVLGFWTEFALITKNLSDNCLAARSTRVSLASRKL